MLPRSALIRATVLAGLVTFAGLRPGLADEPPQSPGGCPDNPTQVEYLGWHCCTYYWCSDNENHLKVVQAKYIYANDPPCYDLHWAVQWGECCDEW
jgi:hypothetical protein